MFLLRVSYRVRAHHVAEFEKAFARQIAPLVKRRGLRLLGVWKTVIGNAGEFMELWEFESMDDLEKRWQGLMRDPRLQEIFKITGPLVEDENFTLFEPLNLAGGKAEQDGSQFV